MPEGLLIAFFTFAAFGAGMTVVGLYLVVDALLDRLTDKK